MDLATFEGFRGNLFDRNCKCIAKSKIKGTLLLSMPDPPASWEWCTELQPGDFRPVQDHQRLQQERHGLRRSLGQQVHKASSFK